MTDRVLRSCCLLAGEGAPVLCQQGSPVAGGPRRAWPGAGRRLAWLSAQALGT